MAAFRCQRFPKGTARIRTAAGLVDFSDGVADVEDEKLAQALRDVPEVFGITEDKPAAARTSTRRTRRTED